MILSRKACSILLIVVLPLSACTAFRTPYVRPALATPPAWDNLDRAPAAAPQDAWWRRFGDERLDRLVERVLARNNDLAAAAITLRRAQIEARFAVINPTLNGSAGYNDTVPLNTGARTVTVGGYSFSTGATASQSFNSSLSASYEVDLFQALGAQRDIAKWEAQATRQDLESTRLSLIGTTVDYYYQLAYLNGEISRSQQEIAYAQTVLDLVRLHVRAGDASPLDESLAAQSLAGAQASLQDLIEQRVEARNGLGLLLDGETVSPDEELPSLRDTGPPDIDAGLPSSLLGRRPDLRAAELRLHEQLAGVDQARLSLYPALDLTGSLGASSPTLANLVQNPVGTLGADIALPLLNFNQVRLNVGVSRATYDLAVVNFRQTFYRALTDVENALAQREQYARQATDLRRSLDEALAVERLDQIRYRAGAAPLKTLLDDQEARRLAESSLAAVRLSQLRTFVALCKALGGDVTATRATALTDRPP